MGEEITEKKTVKSGSATSVNDRIQIARFWARFLIAAFAMSIFLYIVFTMLRSSVELPSSSKDLLNILIGAFIPTLSGIAKFYFDSGDDMEHKPEPKPTVETT